MMKMCVDFKILDNENQSDELRRRLQESRENQAETNGYRRGFNDGYEAGLQAGRKLEQENVAKLWAAIIKGDIS